MATRQVMFFGLLVAPLIVTAPFASGQVHPSTPPHIDISSACASELNSTKINFVLRKVPQILNGSKIEADPVLKILEKVNPKHNRIFYHTYPLDSDESAIEKSEELTSSELYAFYPRPPSEDDRENAPSRVRREAFQARSGVNSAENTAIKNKDDYNSTKPGAPALSRKLTSKLFGGLEKAKGDVSKKTRRSVNRFKRALTSSDDLSDEESIDYPDVASNSQDDPEMEEMFLKHMARLSPGTLARVVDRIAQVANLQEPSKETST